MFTRVYVFPRPAQKNAFALALALWLDYENFFGQLVFLFNIGFRFLLSALFNNNDLTVFTYFFYFLNFLALLLFRRRVGGLGLFLSIFLFLYEFLFQKVHFIG